MQIWLYKNFTSKWWQGGEKKMHILQVHTLLLSSWVFSSKHQTSLQHKLKQPTQSNTQKRSHNLFIMGHAAVTDFHYKNVENNFLKYIH